MATYDYRCPQDGSVFELTFKMGEAPSSAPCPECGEDAPRMFSAPLTTPPGLDRSGPGGMTPIAAPPGRRPPAGPPGAGPGLPPMAATMRPNIFNNP